MGLPKYFLIAQFGAYVNTLKLSVLNKIARAHLYRPTTTRYIASQLISFWLELLLVAASQQSLPGRTRISPIAYYFSRANFYCIFLLLGIKLGNSHFTCHKTRHFTRIFWVLCTIVRCFYYAQEQCDLMRTRKVLYQHLCKI